MAATGLSAEQATSKLQGSRVVLACDNSPSSTTLSGKRLHSAFPATLNRTSKHYSLPGKKQERSQLDLYTLSIIAVCVLFIGYST